MVDAVEADVEIGIALLAGVAKPDSQIGRTNCVSAMSDN
jgi:hypothetical protein